MKTKNRNSNPDKNIVKLYWMLISLVYILLTLINVFTNYETREFMGVDENSIIGSINALFEQPIYDMNGAYHSRVYGWTYFVLNFLAVAPLKLTGLDSEIAVNLTVKFTHFFIGYALVLSFFKLARKIIPLTPAFFSTLFLIATPVTHYYIVSIHPESLGSLLFIWGLISIGKIGTSKDKYRYYLAALVFFSLSSLCKQVFFLISLPCMIYFWWIQFSSFGRARWQEYVVLKEGQLKSFVIHTFTIPLLVLFFIHPYFIIDFQQSIEYQLRPLSHSKGDISDSSIRWLEQFSLHPLFLLHSFLLLSIPFRLKGDFSTEFKYSVVIVTILTLLFCFMQKLMPKAIYLFPLYPIYILNIAYFIFGQFWPRKSMTIIYVVTSVFILPQLAAVAFERYYFAFSKFYFSKNRTSYLAYESISELPFDVNIMYMPSVPMPSTHKNNSCHVWQSCNNIENLRKISPDILYINWDYEYFNKEMYKKFVTEEGYVLEYVINPTVDKTIKNNCKETDFVEIINPFSIPHRIKRCMDSIEESAHIYHNNLFVGSPINIYRKI